MRKTLTARLTALALLTGCSLAAQAASYTSAPSLAIADNSTIHDTMSVADDYLIDSLSVTIAADHSFVGDLVFRLVHNGTNVLLMHRPGKPDTVFGDSANLSADAPLTFTMAAAETAESIGSGCTSSGDIVGLSAGCLSTDYLPDESLMAFTGMNVQGNWRLIVRDKQTFDTGTLWNWTLNVTPAQAVPEPGSFALAGLALAGVLVSRRHRPARSAA